MRPAPITVSRLWHVCRRLTLRGFQGEAGRNQPRRPPKCAFPEANSAPAPAVLTVYLRNSTGGGAWPGPCTETDTTLPGGGVLNGKEYIGDGDLSGSNNRFGCDQRTAQS